MSTNIRPSLAERATQAAQTMAFRYSGVASPDRLAYLARFDFQRAYWQWYDINPTDWSAWESAYCTAFLAHGGRTA